MEQLKQLLQPEIWKSFLSNDFNRGYLTAAAIILGIVVVMDFIKIVLKILFRNRRCSVLVVPRSDGDLIISKNALTEAVKQELRSYSDLTIRKIILSCCGSRYYISLVCDLCSNSRGIPELSAEIKPKVQNMLKELFGIDNISAVKFSVENYLTDDEKSDVQVITPYADPRI